MQEHTAVNRYSTVKPRDDARRIAELEEQLAQAHRREFEQRARIAELEAQQAAAANVPLSAERARLSTLMSVGAALLVTHEIESVLELVVRECATLFPGTAGAVLFLEDPESRRIAVRLASEGSPHVHELGILTIGNDVIFEEYTFVAPRALIVGHDEVDAVLSTIHADAYALLQQTLPSLPVASAIFAPLRNDQRGMGALLLYRTSDKEAYHGTDLPFAQTLADLSAVAITETYQRAQSAALQRDLSRIQVLHREAQARLDTAQAQLLQSAKLAAIGELSASVAHEINNPLYAARNSLFLISQELPVEADTARQFLNIAQGELGRIARIITRMRDFYRPSRAEYTETHVNSLLHDTVAFVQTYLRHNNITAVDNLTTDLPTITAHGDQLRQVFLNLVLNACDAMPQGGTLTLNTRLLPPTDVLPARIEVGIADTGVGIDPQHMQHLFEPFYTTKPQGTGLGLAISAHIVTQHGGDIQVHSTLGHGTVFVISLPLDPPRNAQPTHDDCPAN